MKVEAERNSRIEGSLRFVGRVDIHVFARLHVALFVVHRRIDNSVANSLQQSSQSVSDQQKHIEGKAYLRDNVLGVFLTVELQLEANVAQGDTRVRERDHPHAGLDNVVAETENGEEVRKWNPSHGHSHSSPEDEFVGVVGLESGSVLGKGFLELGKVANSNGCDNLELAARRHRVHIV